MFNYGSLKLFFTKSLFGLVFLSISAFLLLSLISFDPNDPGFGLVSNSGYVNNFMGAMGSYTSGIFLFLLETALIQSLCFF